MNHETIINALTKEKLQEIFPPERTDDFFEALFGDASEGAYNIELAFRELKDTELVLELRLNQRPGCCLACNLTQGLPQVFSRHPVINIDGVVKDIDDLLGEECSCKEWQLGYTEQRDSSLHLIPLSIQISAT